MIKKEKKKNKDDQLETPFQLQRFNHLVLIGHHTLDAKRMPMEVCETLRSCRNAGMMGMITVKRNQSRNMAVQAR